MPIPTNLLSELFLRKRDFTPAGEVVAVLPAGAGKGAGAGPAVAAGRSPAVRADSHQAPLSGLRSTSTLLSTWLSGVRRTGLTAADHVPFPAGTSPCTVISRHRSSWAAQGCPKRLPCSPDLTPHRNTRLAPPPVAP